MNLVFVHIPRTAGTSLFVELRRIYGKKIYHDKGFRFYRHESGLIICNREAESKIHQFRSRFDVNSHQMVFGHFSIDKYWGLGWDHVTFFRDPVDRLISYYNVFLKQNPRTKLRSFVKMHSNFMSELAGDDLSRFAFVGIVEEMNESLKRLRAKYDLKIPVPIMKINHHGRYKTYRPSDKEIELIEKYNRKDRWLYNQALKKFHGEGQ